ncbi:MAG TPA: hypothetical protein VHW00_21640 [Thermoanaerobaculia bacterium]|nr:hypothetical protein [Thermoanaerobaculia bacterium]
MKSKGKRQLQSPDRVWFRAALAGTVLLAASLAWWFYAHQVSKRSIEGALTAGAREELAALPVPAIRTAEVERSWVAEGFSSESLVAPVGPMPCAGVVDAVAPADQNVLREALAAAAQPDADVRIEQLASIHDGAPRNLLVAQMLGTALVEEGRYPEGESVLTRGLEQSGEDETIIRAARVNTQLDLDDLSVSTVIHLHHALGVARLSQSSAEPPWVSLKNVIGSVKPLAKRRLLGTTRGQPAWSRLLIAAPGCAPNASPRALSTYDLFNNLVVGYMRGTFTGTNRDRDREFSRPRKNYPGAIHKLLLVQVGRAKANDWANEAQLWALSNVEQIIDWRMPDDARLAFNSVQVIDWWTAPERCPADACTPQLLGEINKVRDQLVEQVFRRRNVDEEQRGAFARGAVRLLATSSLDRSRIADAATAIREWLPPAERRTLDDLLNADAARRAMPRHLFAPQAADAPNADDAPPPAEPPYAKLGARADKWRAAALTDVAAMAAKWASQRPPAEQRAALVAIRQLLGGAEAPPELLQLERQRSFFDRLRLRIVASKAYWAFLAIVLGLSIWFVLLWILVHVREARLLRVSLYNVEHEYLAGIERDPRR